MRRMGICEERGSGWDKVAFQVEFHQLPAPEVVTTADTTRVTLLSPRPLVPMLLKIRPGRSTCMPA